MALSARATKALAILTEGGEFVKRLEGRGAWEKWRYHLMTKGGSKVHGIGMKAFYELESKLISTGGGTSVSSYYKLRP